MRQVDTRDSKWKSRNKKVTIYSNSSLPSAPWF